MHLAKSPQRQYESTFLGLLWSRVSETNILRTGVAFQFSRLNITVTDYAMAIFFLKKISVIHYALCLEFVLITLSSISGKLGSNLTNFSESCHFMHIVTVLPPRNNNCGTRKMIFENFLNASLACIIERMSILFLILLAKFGC